jgi:hypothetical protein
MAQRTDEKPEHWDDRTSRRDGEPAPVTSGARFGMTGPGALRGWLVVIALLSLVVFVNVTTQMDDARRGGGAMPISLPLTLELTSAIASCVAATIILAAVRLAPPTGRPYWRTAAIHLGGSLAFSAVHVGLMTLLRLVVFAAAGQHYSWSLLELPYEYRKDVLSYAVVAGIFWLLNRRASLRPAADATAPADPPTFDIRDGASLVRAPVAEILAVKAAGNYVEFALEDGRRPLMRASMAQVETALAPHGFVRTHRSWLVNLGRVRALSATGSGDFRIDLGCGLTALSSRRYPEALARLRGERADQGA